MEELKKPFYVAEVGTPLQKALVNNFEAQKQLEQVLDKYVLSERERIVGIIEKYEHQEPIDDSNCHWAEENIKEGIISTITNKSDINN